MTSAPADQALPLDTFEVRLYIARWHAGRLSAKQAAARVGVSDTTWRNWEKGEHVDAARKPWMMREIAEQLGVPLQWLREGGPLQTETPRPDGPEGEGGAVVRHEGLEPPTRWFGGWRARLIQGGAIVPKAA